MRICKIHRVQCPKRWQSYYMQRHEVGQKNGGLEEEVYLSDLTCETMSEELGSATERYLWHGADTNTVQILLTEGFDSRVSKLTGMMGAGIYFADESAYSNQFSRAPAHAALGGPSRGGIKTLGSTRGSRSQHRHPRPNG